MTAVPFGLIRFGRRTQPILRRVALRARIIVHIDERANLGALDTKLHNAVAEVLAAAGVGVESIQIGMAVDPAWRGAGPVSAAGVGECQRIGEGGG